jgi:hypothetical protein
MADRVTGIPARLLSLHGRRQEREQHYRRERHRSHCILPWNWKTWNWKNFTALPLVNPPSFRAQAAIGRWSRRGSPMLFWSLLLSNEANANPCSIPRFNFRVTSQGPWPAHMTVQSGKSCGSRRWSFGGIFKRALPTTARWFSYLICEI